jgi:hypothetical protein
LGSDPDPNPKDLARLGARGSWRFSSLFFSQRFAQIAVATTTTPTSSGMLS